MGSSTRARAAADTAAAEPIAVSRPSARSSSAWLMPASSSALAADEARGGRPWWLYTVTSAVASALVSFAAFSWSTGEAAADQPPDVDAPVQVIAFDPASLEDPELPSLRDDDRDAMREAGLRLARHGDHRSALPYLEAAAVRLPTDGEVQLQLGDTRLALGEVDLARQHYRAAEKAGNTDATLRLRLLGS